jgi:hypothetical protein
VHSGGRYVLDEILDILRLEKGEAPPHHMPRQRCDLAQQGRIGATVAILG